MLEQKYEVFKSHNWQGCQKNICPLWTPEGELCVNTTQWVDISVFAATLACNVGTGFRSSPYSTQSLFLGGLIGPDLSPQIWLNSRTSPKENSYGLWVWQYFIAVKRVSSGARWALVSTLPPCLWSWTSLGRFLGVSEPYFCLFFKMRKDISHFQVVVRIKYKNAHQFSISAPDLSPALNT